MQFDDYLQRWQLVPDGEPIVTHSSRLLPVRRNGQPGMLKIAIEPDEKAGGDVMVWWNGDGAAQVWEYADGVLLLERATGKRSLHTMATNGHDEEATRILCAATACLHQPKALPPPTLKPLDLWFNDLLLHGHKYSGVIAEAEAMAKQLLANQQEIVVLHGDVHHDNFLDFEARGWLAIDPKWIVGDRAFDYANIFCNPDFSSATPPERFLRRLQIVCEETGISRKRMLEWILAWTGLSVVWFLEDNMPAEIDLAVGEMAIAELRK